MAPSSNLSDSLQHDSWRRFTTNCVTPNLKKEGKSPSYIQRMIATVRRGARCDAGQDSIVLSIHTASATR
jgi:hypothetical protein